MKYAHICMDMQLYIVACNIKWSKHEKWKYLILHPGKMHTLMSCLGCIGTLMKASGMEKVLSSTFGCLTSIMNGKAWPQALRAWRMLTWALLSDFLKEGPKSSAEINVYLEKAREHPTGKLWVDCLIRPTMIAHHFLRGECESDLLLHEHSLVEMIPYFFSASHHNYARYITFYLQETKAMSPKV